MRQKANAKLRPNTTNHWKQATERQEHNMIDNRPAIVAMATFTAQKRKLALGNGLGGMQHSTQAITGNLMPAATTCKT